MIKQNSILLVLTLFTIMIMLTAYTTGADAATNSIASSINANTKDINISDNSVYNNNWSNSAWLDNSQIQFQITGHVEEGIGDNYRNTSIEINRGNEFLSWNYTNYNSQKYGDNGYGTLSVLAGPNPMNFREKVNITAILDTIGQQEAQFDDVQYVTLYGIDDASVIDYYGYGDCWSDSCWLYDKLTAAGILVRIMGYEDRGWGDGWRHTWIEINVGNGWQTWDYKKYNSKHAPDNGYGTPFVLIGPGNAPADVMKTGY